jgi:hypothetical protein
MDPKPIERVVLACVQYRSRHVKCDATQPICNRCNRDGKECVYQKSRRGGLDKAALARRRLRLQKDAGNAQDDEGSQHHSSTTSTNNRSLSDTSSSSSVSGTKTCAQLQTPQQTQVAFQVNNERLLDLFFECFWPSFPIVLPPHYLQVRRLNANHGVSELLPVMHWIGSLYEPRQYPSELAESTDSTRGTKLAIWSSLLPSLKKKCLQKNGDMDEVMFTVHMIHAIVISTLHRPFSAPSPFILPASHSRHTARVLRATEMQTRLLAIPCAMKKHSVFTMCITAQLAAVQIAACTHLLDGRPLDIARDRVRLSIGFLSTMGETWALGRKMVREVRGIARESLSASTQQQDGVVGDGDLDKAIEGLQEEMVWPVDLEAGIDIHEGVVIPFDWDITAFGYASSMASGFV